MPDFNRDKDTFHEWMTDAPILFQCSLDESQASQLQEITDEIFYKRFSRKVHSLQTWGKQNKQKGDPHYIGVASGIQMHIDAGFPRYTHQIVLRSTGQLVGYGGSSSDVPRGTFHILDTHSPHSVQPQGPGMSYVALSIDHPIIQSPKKMIAALLEYHANHKF